MSSSTIDYAPQDIGSAATPAEALRANYLYVDAQLAAIAHSHEAVQALVQELSSKPTPDEDARSRLARQLYEVTRWHIFRSAEDAEREAAEAAGYGQMAAQYQAEDAERRQIARRRPHADPEED
jgi:hypothetical protein